jgi:hypothetical protein
MLPLAESPFGIFRSWSVAAAQDGVPEVERRWVHLDSGALPWSRTLLYQP